MVNRNRKMSHDEAYAVLEKEGLISPPRTTDNRKMSHDEAYAVLVKEGLVRPGEASSAPLSVTSEMSDTETIAPKATRGGEPGMMGQIYNSAVNTPGLLLGNAAQAIVRTIAGTPAMLADYLPDSSRGGVTGVPEGVSRAVKRAANGDVSPLPEPVNLPLEYYKGLSDIYESMTPQPTNFYDEVVGGLGSMGGYMAGGALLGGPAGTFASGVGAVAPKLVKTVTGVSGGLLEGAGDATDVYFKNRDRGVSKDEAMGNALKTLAVNIVLDPVTNYLGFVAENKFTKGAFRRVLNASGFTKRFGEAAAEIIASSLSQGGSGALSEWGQETAQGLTSQRYGDGRSWGDVLSAENIKNTMRGEGLVGGVVGGLTGALFGIGGAAADRAFNGRVNVKGKADSDVDEFMAEIVNEAEAGSAGTAQPDYGTEAVSPPEASEEAGARKVVPNTAILNEMRNFYKQIRAIPEERRSAEDRESFAVLRNILELYSSGREEEAVALAKERFETDKLKGAPESAPMEMKERATAELAVPVERQSPPDASMALLNSIRERFVDDFRRYGYGNVDMNTLSDGERYYAALVRAAGNAYQEGDFQRFVNILARLYKAKEVKAAESSPIAAKERATSELAVPWRRMERPETPQAPMPDGQRYVEVPYPTRRRAELSAEMAKMTKGEIGRRYGRRAADVAARQGVEAAADAVTKLELQNSERAESGAPADVPRGARAVLSSIDGADNAAASSPASEAYPVGFTWQDRGWGYDGSGGRFADGVVTKRVTDVKDGKFYVEQDGVAGADVFDAAGIKREIEAAAPSRLKAFESDRRSAEKKAAQDKMASEAKNERERVNGFTDGMSGMRRKQVNDALNKQLRYDGRTMSRREYVEEAAVKADAHVYQGGRRGDYRLYEQTGENGTFTAITKTEHDYFNYLRGQMAEVKRYVDVKQAPREGNAVISPEPVVGEAVANENMRGGLLLPDAKATASGGAADSAPTGRSISEKQRTAAGKRLLASVKDNSALDGYTTEENGEALLAPVEMTADSMKAVDDYYRDSARQNGASGNNAATTAESKGVSLAEGYHTESGRSITEADRDEFVIKPDGSKNFGKIDAVVESQTGGRVKSAAIRLQVGDDNFGLRHIMHKHGRSVMDAGYSHVEEYISDVIKSWDEIITDTDRDGNVRNGRIVLVSHGNERTGIMPLDLELRESGDGYYTVITVIPMSEKKARKKEAKELSLYSRRPSPAAASNSGAVVDDNSVGVGAVPPRANSAKSDNLNVNVPQSAQNSNEAASTEKAVRARGGGGEANAAERLDREYMTAVETGDMESAQKMVNEAAARNGYLPESGYRSSHRAPSRADEDTTLSLEEMRNGESMVPGDFFTHPEYYMDTSDPITRESLGKFRSVLAKGGKATVYRAVLGKDNKEASPRNGDWVSFSRGYARQHGERVGNGKYSIQEIEADAAELFWDGNDVNELGYDNGEGYAYRNTKNNRKLLDAVTRDDKGQVIPLSKRFNKAKADTRYRLVATEQAVSKADVEAFVSGLTRNNANIKKIDQQLVSKTNKMSAQELFDLSKKEVRRLGEAEIITPLGERVYFAPGNTEDVDSYTLHLVAGQNNPLSETKRARVYGLFAAEQTLREPLAVLRQQNGRMFYVSLFDAGGGDMMNGVIVGVEEGQRGRVVTSLVLLDKSSTGKKSMRELKKNIQNAKDVLYLWKGQSGHPRPPTDQHSSMPDVGLPMSGKRSVPQSVGADKSSAAEGHNQLGKSAAAPMPPIDAAANTHSRLGRTAQAQLNKDAAEWEKTLTKLASNRINKNASVRVMDVPLVMQYLDLEHYSDAVYPDIRHLKNLQSGELRTTYNVLTKALYGKHISSISPNMARQLPQKLAEPVMMLHSSPESMNPNGLVAVVQLQDKNDAPVIVSFGLEPHTKKGGGVYYTITSIYGKTMKPDSKVPYPKWMQDQIDRGRLMYYDDTQIPEWEKQNKFKLNLSAVSKKAPARGGLGPIPKSLVRGQELYMHNVLTKADLVKAQNDAPGSYALGEKLAGLPPLSVSEVAARVKGAKVADLGNGRMKIVFSGGTTWIVDVQASEIPVDPDIVRRDYGREVRPEDFVAGRTRVIDGQRFIELAAGMSDARTFSHEVFESAWDSLTKDEQAAVLKTHGSRENAAERYGEFLEGRIGRLTKRTAAIFQRIRDFFSAIRASLFGKNSEDVFRDVAEGRVWGREAKSPSRAERYRRAYGAMQDIVSGAEEATILEARDDVSQYGGTNDVTLLWGDSKKGLAHIGGKRGAEAVGSIVRTVIDGQVLKYVEAKKTLHLGWNGHEAVLSLDENGRSKSWLLTGWVQNRPDAVGEVGAQSNATHNRATFSRSDMGAGLETIVEQYRRLVNEGDREQEHYRLAVRRKADADEDSRSEAQKAEMTDVDEKSGEVTRNIHRAKKQFSAAEQQRELSGNEQWQKDISGTGLESVVSTRSKKKSLWERMKPHEGWWDDFSTDWRDDLHPLLKHFGKKFHMKATNELHGAYSRALYRIQYGVEEKGVKALQDILKMIPDGEHNGFSIYAVLKHLRDVARMSEAARSRIGELDVQRKRKDITKAERKKIENEMESLKKQIKVTKGDFASYDAAVKKVEAHYPHWVAAQAELVKYNKALLEMLSEEGIISRELFDELNARYPNYVPLQRDFGDEKTLDAFVAGRGVVNVSAPIKRLRGSQRDVIDPFEQILRNSFQFETAAARQRLAKELVKGYDEGLYKDVFEEQFSAGDLKELAQKAFAKAGSAKDAKEKAALQEEGRKLMAQSKYARPLSAHSPTESVFYVYENGKKRHFKADNDIYQALTLSGTQFAENNIIKSLATFPAKTLRAGTTHGLTFAIRNMPRDTVSYAVLGEDFRPFVDTAIGMTEAITGNKELYKDFVKHGGLQGVTNVSADKMADLLHELKRDKKTLLLDAVKLNGDNTVWKLLGDISELSETASRLGQYKRLIEAKNADGSLKYTKDEAVYMTRDNMNFMRAGRLARRLNQYIAFFNASIQGVDKMFRTFFKDGKVNKKALLRAGLYITLPSMLQHFYNYSDDERKKRYQNMPAWRKNLFWNFIVGDTAVTIPKPFELGVIFGSLPERMVDTWFANDEAAFEGFTGTLFSAMTPEMAPNLMLLAFELGSGYSRFYDRQIVPQRERRLEREYQYGPYTSEMAKGVAKVTRYLPDFNGVPILEKTMDVVKSPRMLEYAYSQMTGGAGKEFSNLVDRGVRAMRGETRPSKPWWQTMPGFRGIFADASIGGRDQELFQKELLDEKHGLLTKLNSAVEKLETEGPASLSKAQIRLLEAEQAIKYTAKLNTDKNGIYAAYREIRAITLDKQMTADEKAAAIKELELYIRDASQQGLAEVRDIYRFLKEE
ncbi:MAG: hypothetical protein Q4D58_11460 [Synergistaceae bacterium]|nr:hypothetical protein [Synergistaceae bacterium]